VVLVACFVAQTVIVYADHGDTQTLTPEQTRGRRLWQAKNCQVCHQLYGYGGFLGPDLTNASSRFDREHLAQQLRVGNSQMPAFDFEPNQVDDLWSFLQAMNQTGRGQARLITSDPQNTVTKKIDRVIAQAVDESADTLIKQGFEVYRTGTCTGCHTYFARSPVGAPDLSKRVREMNDEDLTRVLEEGKQPRMPKPDLDEMQRKSVAAFLRFLSMHRESLRENSKPNSASFWSTLPWWEYP